MKLVFKVLLTTYVPENLKLPKLCYEKEIFHFRENDEGSPWAKKIIA
jgi:hypothetical protein